MRLFLIIKILYSDYKHMGNINEDLNNDKITVKDIVDYFDLEDVVRQALENNKEKDNDHLQEIVNEYKNHESKRNLSLKEIINYYKNQ